MARAAAARLLTASQGRARARAVRASLFMRTRRVNEARGMVATTRRQAGAVQERRSCGVGLSVLGARAASVSTRAVLWHVAAANWRRLCGGAVWQSCASLCLAFTAPSEAAWLALHWHSTSLHSCEAASRLHRSLRIGMCKASPILVMQYQCRIAFSADAHHALPDRLLVQGSARCSQLVGGTDAATREPYM